MNTEELSKLKQGDVVRHEPSGAGYIVLNNVGGVPTVIRSIQLHTGPDWSHVYTPAPVAPCATSLVDMITELQSLGWKFSNVTDSWTSPDKTMNLRSIRIAWSVRHKYNPAQTPAERRKARWKNPYGFTWKSPAGDCYDGGVQAYKALTS